MKFLFTMKAVFCVMLLALATAVNAQDTTPPKSMDIYGFIMMDKRSTEDQLCSHR